MKTAVKKISTWIILALAGALIFILSVVVSANTSESIPQLRKYKPLSGQLWEWTKLKSINEDSLQDIFPYDEYLDLKSYWNIQSLKTDLTCLDTIFKNDPSQNRVVLSTALTTKLLPRFEPYFNSYQPDSMLILLQWAEKFKNYAEFDQENDIFYGSIYDYWTDKIASKITLYAAQQPSRKYDFKFRYLLTRCIEQRVSPSTKTTPSEKVFNNLIYSKWGHLADASWNQTSLLQKIIFFALLFFTAWGYVLLLNKIIHYFKKSHHA